MSFVSDIFSGSSGASASRSAAESQEKATKRAIRASERALSTVRADLQPFREAGAGQLTGLSELISDPEAQRRFVTENPFFESLASDAERRLLSNAAARGKVGSGGTAAALQDALLRLGTGLVGQNVQQRQNLATLGANAAAGQATATQQTGSNVANLITGAGNAQAAGQIGAANARQAGFSNLLNTGLGVAALTLSDIRAKTDIRPLGETPEGIGIYVYRYRGDDKPQVGVMAQEVELKHPEAVAEVGGLKHVNLGALADAH